MSDDRPPDPRRRPARSEAELQTNSSDHLRLYTKVHCTPGQGWLRFRGPVPTDQVWTAKQGTIMLTPLLDASH